MDSRPHHPLVVALRRGTLLSAGIRLASVGLAFLFFLALARTSTPDAFGEFSAAYSLAIILSYCAMVGQHVAILRFWPALDEAHGAAVASGALRYGLLLVLLAGSIIGSAVALLGLYPPAVAAFGSDPMNFTWTGVLVLACAIAEFAASALRAKGWMILALAPRDIAWRLIVILGALLATYPLSAASALSLTALGLLVVCLPQVAILVADVWRHRHAVLPEVDRHQMHRTTFVLWLSTSTTPMIVHATTVVAAMTLGPVAAGTYFAADRLAKLLTIVLDGIQKVSAPMLSRSFHSGRLDEVRLIVSGTSTLAFAGAVVGALAYLALGRLALEAFDPSYGDSYLILLILAAGQVVNAACGSNTALLNMAGRERDQLVIRLIWGALSLVSVYFGSIWFGLTGTAIASTGILIGWNLTAVIVCQRRIGILPIVNLGSVHATMATIRSMLERTPRK